MSDIIELNIIQLFGKINKNTPICVILDLLRRIDINLYNRLITATKITKNKVLEDIIFFINRNPIIKIYKNKLICTELINLLGLYDMNINKITKKEFLEIYKFVMGEYKTYFHDYNLDYEFSDKINITSYKVLTPILAYNLGIELGIEFDKNDNFNRIIEKLKDSRNKVYSKDELILLYNTFHNIRFLQKKLDVKSNNTAAISLCFILYGINIMDSLHPIQCFNQIKNYSSITNDYKNILFNENSSFSSNYNLCPQYYLASFTFTDKFPIEYYKDQHLSYLLEINGYYYIDYMDKKMKYDELIKVYKDHRFYHKIAPFCDKKETAIDFIEYDEIKNRNDILTFGNEDFNILLTFEELNDTFNQYQNFTNPFLSNSLFTNEQITFLKNILFEYYISDESNQLLETIIKIENKNDTDLNLILIDENKNYIFNILNKLEDITLYMRGWDGDIKNKPYYECPTLNENRLIELENIIHNLLLELGKNEYYYLLYKLPLFIYKSGTFIRNYDKDLGLSIGDRIDIICSGNTTNNESSCIRVSSNYFCWNIYYYYLSLGFELPFNINKLRIIS